MPQSSKLGLPLDLGALDAPEPGLHLVATPIGNLGDITLRALTTLARADIVYCEDTRHTRRLLDRYSLKPRLRAYHDHNATEMRPEILARLAAGERVALVSDAGTPLISDPGFKLVREALAAGHRVTAEPGPSAAIAALTLSGLPTDRFLFLGFLAAKSAARRAQLVEVRAVKASLILYEAPSRLGATLVDLNAVLGPRQAAVARELTKLHEEVRRGSLAELAADVAARGPPKGEIVIVVAPPEGEAAASEADLDAALEDALGRLSLKAAVAEVAADLALPRKSVYARALALTGKKRD